MAGKQSAQLERKKFFADPIMVSMIVVLLVFLALFILYPLLMLLVQREPLHWMYLNVF